MRKQPKAGGIRAHAHLESRTKELDADEPLRVDKVDRNAPCPCGSGAKYKRCCASKEGSFFTVLRGFFGI